MEQPITIIQLILSLLPLFGGMVGVYVKLSNLTAQQQIRIDHLESRAEAHSNRIAKLDTHVMTKLDELSDKIDDVRLHAFRCINFKTNVK
jgi:hypothetical protein